MSKNISQQFLGILGLMGDLIFLLVLTFLQLFRTDLDWTSHYVSDFVNGPYGTFFIIAILIHGIGNFALALGLSRSLELSSLRKWALIFFIIAALNVLAVGIFPIDPSDGLPSTTGLVHQVATALSFPLELVALFLFSFAFSRSSDWEMQRKPSFVLSTFAAGGLFIFFVTVLANKLPGLGERVALLGFFLWEVWAAWHLIKKSVIKKLYLI